MLREEHTMGLGRPAGYISGCAERFYGTRVGPGWYQTATSAPRVRGLPFSALRVLMHSGFFRFAAEGGLA
jgi:hypothetical protein